MTRQRLAVLRELVWLCDEAPAWAQPVPDLDGEVGWLPFHVRFFRPESYVKAAGMNIEQVKRQLRVVARDGYADTFRKRAGYVSYKATDKAREAVRERA